MAMVKGGEAGQAISRWVSGLVVATWLGEADAGKAISGESQADEL